MTVFVSRVRQGYLRRRSTREMVIATLCFVAFIALLGLAGRDQLQEETLMSEVFTPQRRVCIVNWADSVPVYEVGQ